MYEHTQNRKINENGNYTSKNDNCIHNERKANRSLIKYQFNSNLVLCQQAKSPSLHSAGEGMNKQVLCSIKGHKGAL